MPRYEGNRRWLILSDAAGISHFIVANLVVLLGQFTSAFADIGGKYPGLAFVYKYFDSPIASIPWVAGLVNWSLNSSVFMVFTVGEMIIIAASVVYGGLVYLLCRLLMAIFVD